MANRQHTRRHFPHRRRLWFALALVLGLVLFASRALARVDVWSLVVDEERNLAEQGFAIKDTTFVLRDPYSMTGITVICTANCGRIVVLRDFYWDERQARKVIVHEYGHVLMYDLGIPQSEEAADRFAACFGTDKAKEWATMQGIAATDCDELAKAFGRSVPSGPLSAVQ